MTEVRAKRRKRINTQITDLSSDLKSWLFPSLLYSHKHHSPSVGLTCSMRVHGVDRTALMGLTNIWSRETPCVNAQDSSLCMIKFPNLKKIRFVKIPKFLSACMMPHFSTKVESYQSALTGDIFDTICFIQHEHLGYIQSR